MQSSRPNFQKACYTTVHVLWRSYDLDFVGKFKNIYFLFYSEKLENFSISKILTLVSCMMTMIDSGTRYINLTISNQIKCVHSFKRTINYDYIAIQLGMIVLSLCLQVYLSRKLITFKFYRYPETTYGLMKVRARLIHRSNCNLFVWLYSVLVYDLKVLTSKRIVLNFVVSPMFLSQNIHTISLASKVV